MNSMKNFVKRFRPIIYTLFIVLIVVMGVASFLNIKPPEGGHEADYATTYSVTK